MGATGLSPSVDLDSGVLCIPVWCGVGAVQELCVNVSFLGNNLSSLGVKRDPVLILKSISGLLAA